MKKILFLIAFIASALALNAQVLKRIDQLPANTVVHDTDLIFIGHPADGRLFKQQTGVLLSYIFDSVNNLLVEGGGVNIYNANGTITDATRLVTTATDGALNFDAPNSNTNSASFLVSAASQVVQGTFSDNVNGKIYSFGAYPGGSYLNGQNNSIYLDSVTGYYGDYSGVKLGFQYDPAGIDTTQWTPYTMVTRQWVEDRLGSGGGGITSIEAINGTSNIDDSTVELGGTFFSDITLTGSGGSDFRIFDAERFVVYTGNEFADGGSIDIRGVGNGNNIVMSEINSTYQSNLTITAADDLNNYSQLVSAKGATTKYFRVKWDNGFSMVGMPSGGVGADSVMVITSAGLIKKRNAASFGGGAAVAASNGLSIDGGSGDVFLGGSELSQNTRIGGGSGAFDLSIDTVDQFTVKTDNQVFMNVNDVTYEMSLNLERDDIFITAQKNDGTVNQYIYLDPTVNAIELRSQEGSGTFDYVDVQFGANNGATDNDVFNVYAHDADGSQTQFAQTQSAWTYTWSGGAVGNVSVGGAGSVNNSAILQVRSTTQGFLPPSMTGAQAEAISTPADGLMIFCSNGNGSTINSIGIWVRYSSTWNKL